MTTNFILVMIISDLNFMSNFENKKFYKLSIRQIEYKRETMLWTQYFISYEILSSKFIYLFNFPFLFLSSPDLYFLLLTFSLSRSFFSGTFSLLSLSFPIRPFLLSPKTFFLSFMAELKGSWEPSSFLFTVQHLPHFWFTFLFQPANRTESKQSL